MSDWEKHILNLTEVFRCAAEAKKLHEEWPRLRQTAPNGDGHPVLILPPFVGDDLITIVLRNALKEKGHDVHTWNGGINLGINERTIRHLEERLEEIYKKSGKQKVSLVGHSLGGIYARELAREFPHMVRNVITIGTPFGVGIEKGHVPASLHTLIEALGDKHLSMKDEDIAKRCMTPPPVPTTSIFSKTDGIAGWKACLNPAAPQAENIEVTAGHAGMLCSAETFAIVLDRLAQSAKKWKPYKNASKEKAPANPKWKPGPASKKFFK